MLKPEQIEAKAKELSEKEGCKVTPFVLTAQDGEQIVGYLREPTADTVLYIGDAMLEGKSSLGREQALKDMLLVEESSKRIENTQRRNSLIYTAACREAATLTIPMQNEYKKK